MKKKAKKKLKSFAVHIKFSSYQIRYFEAKSKKEAKKMFENGDFDSEYDFEECCENDEFVKVVKVKQ